jgi:hypothetical protein
MKFKKGSVPWNKGLTKDTDSRVADIAAKIGNNRWNKGLTKETDARVVNQARLASIKNKGKESWSKGQTRDNNPILANMGDRRKGKTKDNCLFVFNQSLKIKGRTKDTHEGVKSQSLKMSGRSKETHEGNRKQSEKLTGRNKNNTPYLEKILEKLKGVYVGEKSPKWIDGRSFLPYPKEFNEHIKRYIRSRDNYVCQKCGITEGECIRKLDIHHINYSKVYISEMDLISLCVSCNSAVNKNREFWQRYFKDKLIIRMNKVECLICG